MSKPKKNREKARQFKGLGNSGLKNIFPKVQSGSVNKLCGEISHALTWKFINYNTYLY